MITAALLAGFSAGCDDAGAPTSPPTAPPAAPVYALIVTDFTELGTLGGTTSQATSINAHGQVVGESGNVDNATRAFLLDDGAMIDLGTLGGNTSIANAINDRGQIVGLSVTADALTHPFLWEDGVMTDLGTLGGSPTVATDINDHGQVVGSGFSPSQGGFRAWFWDGGALQDLGAPEGRESFAVGINDLGQIVGTTFDEDQRLRPFLWMDGVMYEFGALGGRDVQSPIRINNLGEVVAGSGAQAVRWQVVIRADVRIDGAVRLSGGGSITAVVFGSPYFDATVIDPLTVTLGDEAGSDTPAIRTGSGQVRAQLRDVNRDGFPDLLLDFDKRQMVANGDLGAVTGRLVLLGGRTDGRRIRGVAGVDVR